MPRLLTAAVLILALAACREEGQVVLPVSTIPAEQAPVYARQLLEVHGRHLGAHFAKADFYEKRLAATRAAEAVRLLSPPAGFEERHRRLYWRLHEAAYWGGNIAAIEGAKADVELTALARDAGAAGL